MLTTTAPSTPGAQTIGPPEDLAEVVEHDESAVLCRLDDARVAGRSEGEPVRSADPGFEEVLDGLCDRARVVGDSRYRAGSSRESMQR